MWRSGMGACGGPAAARQPVVLRCPITQPGWQVQGRAIMLKQNSSMRNQVERTTHPHVGAQTFPMKQAPLRTWSTKSSLVHSSSSRRPVVALNTRSACRSVGVGECTHAAGVAQAGGYRAQVPSLLNCRLGWRLHAPEGVQLKSTAPGVNLVGHASAPSSSQLKRRQEP